MEYFVVIRSKPAGYRMSKMMRIILGKSYESKELAMFAYDVACKISHDKSVVFGVVCQTLVDF